MRGRAKFLIALPPLDWTVGRGRSALQWPATKTTIIILIKYKLAAAPENKIRIL